MIAFYYALCYQNECIQILRHFLTKFVYVHFWSFWFFHILCTAKTSRLPAVGPVSYDYYIITYFICISFASSISPRSDPRILARGGLFRISISYCCTHWPVFLHTLLLFTWSCRVLFVPSQAAAAWRPVIACLRRRGKFPIDICGATW